MNCKLLFVYGTLMRGATGRLGAGERRRLAREGVCLGAAYVCGRLYDLGAYPGLVVPCAAGDIVLGELIEMSTPEATLGWLDAYEGVGTGGNRLDEYRRQAVEVQFAGNGNSEAWAYVYQQDIAALRRVNGGRWLGGSSEDEPGQGNKFRSK